jgi:hypothetical protein
MFGQLVNVLAPGACVFNPDQSSDNHLSPVTAPSVPLEDPPPLAPALNATKSA